MPSGSWEAKRDALLESKIPSHFTKYENFFVKTDNKWCAGDKLTAPDFHLWEMMDQIELLAKVREGAIASRAAILSESIPHVT